MSSKLFITTTLFIIAGLISSLGAVDRVQAMVSGIGFIAVSSRETLELRTQEKARKRVRPGPSLCRERWLKGGAAICTIDSWRLPAKSSTRGDANRTTFASPI